MELFFSDGATAFFAFSSAAERNQFHQALRGLRLPRLAPFLGATAEERWKKENLVERWSHGGLSNFEFLLRVNRLAGRR